MELKVWVEGIQRVVCGANFSTTCQDVVLALAHAMGRTGRFTLVEKWRDAERPLTPGECPLQCLHKWGEYAAEVKFYLVQAETEKVRQKSQSNYWQDKSDEQMDKFSHNFSPTPPQKAPVPPMTDTIKRSSTFSGAHSPNFRIPHSSSTSGITGNNQIKPQQPYQNQRRYSPRSSSSQQQYQNQLQSLPEHVPSRPRNSSQTRQQQRQHLQPHSSASLPSSYHSGHHLPNGDITALSSTSSNNSSPRSSSQSSGRTTLSYGHSQPPSNNNNTSSLHAMDARHLHPANLPGTHEGRSHRPLDVDHQRGRPATSQHSQQYRQPSPSQLPASTPTPAPRSHHRHRPASASPTSQQYENLPPVKNSRDTLPAGQSLSTFQVPRPRRSSSAGRRSSNEENASTQHSNSQPSRENSFFTEKAVPIHRAAPDGHCDSVNSRTNPVKNNAVVLDSRSGQPFPKNETGSRSPDRGNRTEVNNFPYVNSSRDYHGKDLTSRSHPSDSFVPAPSHGVPVKSVSQRTSENQSVTKSLSSLPAPNVPERTRRSQGDKVSFVESAFLKQHRSGKETQDFAPSPSTLPRQDSNPEDKRYQGRDKSGNHTSEPNNNNYSDSRVFAPNNYHQSALPSTASSHHTAALPLTSNAQPYYHDHARPPSSSPPNNFFSSPRRHSAFKEVSPRSSRPNSASSPAGELSSSPFVAYDLDNQNFDNYVGPHARMPDTAPDSSARSHSRQASLEIEEYDLDQNFPDVFAKDSFSGPRTTARNGHDLTAGKYGPTHTEYVMDGPTSSAPEMEPEYMHLLRKVNMQRERIKMVEVQTNELSSEIESLEVEESNLTMKLEVVNSELESLGKKEESYQMELDDLERVEWVNVVDGELKCEQDLRKQMTSLKDGLSKLEMQIQDAKSAESAKLEEIRLEEERIAQGKAKKEKEDEEMKLEIMKAGKALQESDEMLAPKKEKVNELLTRIADMEKLLSDQETKFTGLESELNDENLKDFQAHPVPKEAGPESPTPDVTETQPITRIRHSSDTGEAILKILEEGRSPRMSPAMEEIIKSPLAAKNPNGVWV